MSTTLVLTNSEVRAHKWHALVSTAAMSQLQPYFNATPIVFALPQIESLLKVSTTSVDRIEHAINTAINDLVNRFRDNYCKKYDIDTSHTEIQNKLGNVEWMWMFTSWTNRLEQIDMIFNPTGWLAQNLKNPQLRGETEKWTAFCTEMDIAESDFLLKAQFCQDMTTCENVKAAMPNEWPSHMSIFDRHVWLYKTLYNMLPVKASRR